MAESENSDCPTETISINDEFTNKNNTVDDDRIECSNSHYLDKIYEVALRNVTKLAESHLNEDKQQFINRFSEVFKDFIKENVTVKGLPWNFKEEKLTAIQMQEQTEETTDALLSKLSKKLEKTAEKRKIFPDTCRRISYKQFTHERQNLKKIKLDPSLLLPSISSLPEPSLQDHFKDLSELSQNMRLTQQKIARQTEKLSFIQKQIEFARNITEQHNAHSKTLHDTGYLSE